MKVVVQLFVVVFVVIEGFALIVLIRFFLAFIRCGRGGVGESACVAIDDHAIVVVVIQYVRYRAIGIVVEPILLFRRFCSAVRFFVGTAQAKEEDAVEEDDDCSPDHSLATRSPFSQWLPPPLLLSPVHCLSNLSIRCFAMWVQAGRIPCASRVRVSPIYLLVPSGSVPL